VLLEKEKQLKRRNNLKFKIMPQGKGTYGSQVGRPKKKKMMGGASSKAAKPMATSVYKKGGAAKKKKFKAHMMYSKSGKAVRAGTMKKHLELKAKGYNHDKRRLKKKK
tara:strand:- start:179 stop:502 length:324 start_codon:yes stop_codon:yes gene_type:complete